MKNSKFVALVILCLSVTGLFFTSCKKTDLPNDPGGNGEPLMLVGAWEYWDPFYQNCRWGGVVCINSVSDEVILDDLLHLELVDNQVIGTGSLGSKDGHDVLSFEFSRHQLGEEATHRLLEEKIIELEDNELDANLVKQLYKNAGKEYINSPVNIKQGMYEVKVFGDESGEVPTAENMKIKVDITLLGAETVLEYSVFKK